MKSNKGILFAADIPDKNQLFSVLEQVKSYIAAIKIGNLVLYEHSWSIIKEIKNLVNLPLIADLKLLDMPDMVGKITKCAVNSGADGIMVAGSIGVEGIMSCKEYLKEKLLFVFTQFTHCDGLISKEEANKYIDLAIDMNCTGIQVPATIKGRIREVREKIGNKFIIISCGVGTQKFYGDKIEGPTIGSALIEGADYEIVGRTIYQNPFPKDAAKFAYSKISEIITLN